MKICVVIPDLNSAVSSGRNSDVLEGLESLQNSGQFDLIVVKALVNGQLISAPCAKWDVTVDRIMTDGSSLADTLAQGYGRIRDHIEDMDFVVRMDASEHSAHIIPKILAEMRSQCAPVCVVNLLYDRDMLGPFDVQASLAFKLYCLHFFKNRLTLGLAHGFQCFEAKVFAQISRIADDIQSHVVMRHGEMLWGFDLAMLCAAEIHGLKIAQLSLPASLPRFRRSGKIVSQLKALVRVLHAGRKLQGLELPSIYKRMRW